MNSSCRTIFFPVLGSGDLVSHSMGSSSSIEGTVISEEKDVDVGSRRNLYGNVEESLSGVDQANALTHLRKINL